MPPLELPIFQFFMIWRQFANYHASLKNYNIYYLTQRLAPTGVFRRTHVAECQKFLLAPLAIIFLLISNSGDRNGALSPWPCTKVEGHHV
jgi:hypothetical protein